MGFTGAYKHICSSFNCQLPHSQPEAFGAPVRLGPPGSLPTFSVLNPDLDSWDTQKFLQPLRQRRNFVKWKLNVIAAGLSFLQFSCWADSQVLKLRYTAQILRFSLKRIKWQMGRIQQKSPKKLIAKANTFITRHLLALGLPKHTVRGVY